MVYLNTNIMASLISKNNSVFMRSEPQSDPNLYSYSCTVPNASISPREILQLYARGEQVPTLPTSPDEGDELRSVMVDTDNMAALQHAKSYVAALKAAQQKAALPPAAASQPPAESPQSAE